MNNSKINRVVIVGGGSAGWISAALLVRLLGRAVDITLVESEEIGTIGVGEATIPPILALNAALGLDEAEFMRETGATIKLGIEFENWKTQGDSYMHAFGGVGKDFPFCSFHNFWSRYQQSHQDSNFWDYSVNYQAARQNKYAKLDKLEGTNLQGLVYAYHFDATRYAAYLRKYSESKGVKRIEGIINHGILDSETGFIQSVVLADGQEVSGDLFIDCSGFRGLLIEEALNTGYENWERWLPCNRAIAVQSKPTEAIRPYTRSIAHDVGWQWQIPLQQRVGNGLVFCSRFIEEEAARDLLLKNIQGELLTEPRTISFQAGRRIKQWNRNCVSIGLASGFLEPLESTSIHMIQSAVLRLVKHFPHNGISALEVNEYNAQSKAEFEHVRDFIISHYYLNQRDDSPFWRQCQQMDIPDSLATKIELFRSSGKVFNPHEALFRDIAWQQVMIGQGVVPNDYHPLAGTLSDEQLTELMDNLKKIVDGAVGKLPSHDEFIQNFCAESK